MNKILMATLLCGLLAAPALAAEKQAAQVRIVPIQLALNTTQVRIVPIQLAFNPSAKHPTHLTTDVIDTALAAGHFKTLVSALKATGLAGVLKGKGPFTVFAPTDTAFAKLPKGALNNLMKVANHKKLVAILTYHVVAGKLMAADLSRHYLLGQAGKPVKYNNSLKTIEGENLAISGTKTMVTVNGAHIIQRDIPCSNGVIHVIDTVLMPPNKR